MKDGQHAAHARVLVRAGFAETHPSISGFTCSAGRPCSRSRWHSLPWPMPCSPVHVPPTSCGNVAWQAYSPSAVG